ncbi:serine peptidase [Achromatium sp. WMS2]|nr:serine peptidase [Achromatium sp. WMS2]
MKRYVITWFTLVLWSISTVAMALEMPDFAALVKKCGPAVVNISTRQGGDMGRKSQGGRMPGIPEDSPFNDLLQRFFGDQGGYLQEQGLHSKSLGSGFFITPDGYILTNYHVVNEADEILVRTNDRREFEARIIGSDQRSDTALIKIDIQNAPVLDIGDSDSLEVGDWVLAIGSPFGFDNSVTQGIVSALNRNLPSESYVPFIQTDVAINPGNSGGPLIDLHGKVVGINSQIYSRTGGFMGLSFAVPIRLAKDVAEQLKQHGRVERGWLGVIIQDVSKDLAQTFGINIPRGALVAGLVNNSPAVRAGIKIGDVILSYNGKDIATSSTLPPLVGTSPINKVAVLHVLRNGKEIDVNVTIGALPDADDANTNEKPGIGKDRNGETMLNRRLGLVIRDLTRQESRTSSIEHGRGVMVEDVTRGSAKDAGLEPGDIILMFDGTEIRNGAKQLYQQIADTKDARTVAILVQRGEDRLFIPMRLP